MQLLKPSKQIGAAISQKDLVVRTAPDVRKEEILDRLDAIADLVRAGEAERLSQAVDGVHGDRRRRYRTALVGGKRAEL
jgi:hypothetical protein